MLAECCSHFCFAFVVVIIFSIVLIFVCVCYSSFPAPLSKEKWLLPSSPLLPSLPLQIHYYVYSEWCILGVGDMHGEVTLFSCISAEFTLKEWPMTDPGWWKGAAVSWWFVYHSLSVTQWICLWMIQVWISKGLILPYIHSMRRNNNNTLP